VVEGGIGKCVMFTALLPKLAERAALKTRVTALEE
tara:strand:- start:1603 stop:1707 length:105 start_codon:yes stop_codon:yes gene_type:complete